MSKRLKEVLASLSHMSLSQTLECENSDEIHGSLRIHLQDQDDEGNRTDAANTRYVKVADSHGFTQIHEMKLCNGEASLLLDNLEASQLVIVQVDGDGNQMIDGDSFAITYYVHQVACEEDYATLYFSASKQNQELNITNRKVEPTTLVIRKTVLDEYYEEKQVYGDMNFVIHIEGRGMKKCIDLNSTNNFQVKFDDLRPGCYCIFEEEDSSYHTTYRLNCEEASQCSEFEIYAGHHELEVINRCRPKSVLTLDKYIRDLNGELMKPQNHEHFRVRVIGDYYDQSFILDCENDFALDILDLPSGFYDVCEESGDMYDVSYLVNGEAECTYAHVEVRECDCAAVLIVNNIRMYCNQDSPLRICKYVRKNGGTLIKPDPCHSFKVMLSGCGVCETFNLNASNNFCVDIDHICCGEYEIRELEHEDYVCSYQINDCPETTSACLCIHEGGRNCISIINEERNKGQVSICKWLRDPCGELVKPDRNARFVVTLRSFFCRENIVLDASNDFCAFIENLKEGSYEVREHRLDGFDTTYLVNGCKEEKKARFIVENGCANDIKVINTPHREKNGDLRICKYIANDFGDYVKPSADEEFEIEVQGPLVEKCYTLRAANNWCIILEGLKKGVYRIREIENCEYTSQYFVNGSESTEVLVCMEQRNQEVEIINTRIRYGNLKLSAMVENCDGCIEKPNMSEAFEILIESSCDSRSITLDCNNNFCVLLDNMDKGKYRITQKDSYGYKVSYEIDNERFHNANVLMECENRCVVIINQMMNCSGMLRVRKWISTLEGELIRPSDDDNFEFRLVSRCLDNSYALTRRNDFCVFFDDLEESEYEIIEECAKHTNVVYRMNGEICDCGRFVLHREDVEIDIINELLPKPKLIVQKWMREVGQLMKPEPCQYFEFILKGRDTHELYTLEAENDWTVCIEGLCNQHYEVKEIKENCHTMYKIDGTLRDDGYFLFEDCDKEVMIINEERYEPVVKIDKFMCDEHGKLVKPCRNECFEVILEGECYKQCFQLTAENDWCVDIEGVPCGKYEVKELGDEYAASFIMNEQEQRDGCFEIEEEDICITMINREACHNEISMYAYQVNDGVEETPCMDARYQVQVECDGKQENFILDRFNDWCMRMEDVNCGCYRISTETENMIYESDGKCFENCIEIDVECENHHVKLLEQCNTQGDIEISKRIQDARGRLIRPQKDECFEIELRGECNESFTLHRGNNWCVKLEDYPQGIYEVYEQGGGCETLYQINGKKPVSQGYFTLKQHSISICVINPVAGDEARCAELIVHSMVKNCDGDLETAMSDASFDVMIDGDNVREDITLSHRNGFQMKFDQLPSGYYTITQTPNDAYTRVTYRVNAKEQPTGAIYLGDEDVQVDAINYENCERGSIHIMKYIKDASCGCLKRPNAEDCYDVEIKGGGMHQIIVLNASNKWSYAFDNLVDGDYEILERGSGNVVTYIVNGGKESDQACIKIAGNDVRVKIINANTLPKPKGSIELCKLMKDGDGAYHYPDKDASYWVSVEGLGETQRILLHNANHFFVEVRGLADATYTIREEDGSGVKYAINGGIEQAEAKVNVSGNNNSVNIINPIQNKGAMTFTKYLQAMDGTLSAPVGEESYRIHVSKPGFNHIVVLNTENKFQSVLNDLQQGQYVVDELDHEAVSYIIDGGNQVDRGIVDVIHQHHDVKVINQNNRSRGSIQMVKYIRSSSGQLVRPQGNVSYQFHVSKPGFNKVIILDQSNQYRFLLEGLDDGNYVIAEDEEENVSYIINNGSETDFGIVNVQRNTNQVQIINAQRSNENGSINITKIMRNPQGEFVTPSPGYQARVHVSKPGYNEIFTLNSANNWKLTIVDLMDGQYVLDEMDSNDDVTWRINGGNEVRYGVVNVEHTTSYVEMINTPTINNGVIFLNKFIRNASGQLVKPEINQSFQISISGPTTQTITLNQGNLWSARLAGISDGSYRIMEISNGDYDVSYIVNNGDEQTSATLTIQGNEQSVGIINTSRESRNMLEITKYMKGANGTLNTPEGTQRYQVEVIGHNYHEIFTLEERNQFSVHLSNLMEGTYSVKESSEGDPFTTTYRINGGQETSSAIVSIQENRNNVVEILNEVTTTQNVLDVYKYIMDAYSNIVKPQTSQVFRFLLTGNNVHQFYTLSSANEWHVCIKNLSCGSYEIIEQNNSQYEVTYLVNGADFTSTAQFHVMDSSKNNIEIVNSPIGANNGVLRFEKKIRTKQGDLIIPGNGESFQIQVLSESLGYDETFQLDERNGYFMSIANLAYGKYQVMELDNSGFGVSYIVNDGEEENSAEINIQSSQIQNVMILNTQVNLFAQSRKKSDIRIVIE